VAKYGGPGKPTDDKIIWRMRFACWINKDTDTRIQYIFRDKEYFRNRASVLRYTFTACLKILSDTCAHPSDYTVSQYGSSAMWKRHILLRL
jgi:hypothetical protein